jgi:hypothetical protein
MNRTKTFAFLTIAIFALSVNGYVSQVSAQSSTLEENFELLLMTNAGNRIRESYAFYIKQAVAPLGIDVEVLAKPFGQFVGDLLHISTGQPFDLAIVGFAGGGPVPDFMWKFHSTRTSFGQLMYQLNNPDWQEFMEADIGVSTAEVDALLEDIDFELDALTRREKLKEFTTLFMTDLLYDLPLTTVTGRSAAWNGYNMPDGSVYDVDEGLIGSRALGAAWDADATPDKRKNADAGLNAIQIRIAVPSAPGMFDPYQVFDTSTGAQSDYTASALMSFDGGFAGRPGVAQQWVMEDVSYDHDNNASTPLANVSNGKHTFIMNPDFEFPAFNYVDKDGNNVTYAAHRVDAHDVALVLDMFNNVNTVVNGKESYTDPVAKWEVSTTLYANDTISIYINPGQAKPDHYVTFGGLTPLPSHILGGDLDYNNGTAETPEWLSTSVVGHVNDTFNPQNSHQWNAWESSPDIALVGAYEIDEHPGDLSIGDFFSVSARADYPYPNEWDIMNTYAIADNKTALDTLYANMNTTGWTVTNLGTWAPHTGQVNDEAYFWAYGANATDMVKPTTQGITEIIVKVIPDVNAALISFENGDLDVFGSSSLGANTVAEHSNNPDFNVQETFPLSGPQLLVFNLLNEHLQKRNVRYAIASVLDKDEMTKINDGFAKAQHAPTWLVYDKYAPIDFKGAGANGEDLSWYTPVPVPVDYPTARDLMRLEGYKAAEDNSADTEIQEIPVDNVVETIFGTVFEDAGIDFLLGFSIFAFTATTIIRRQKLKL